MSRTLRLWEAVGQLAEMIPHRLRWATRPAVLTVWLRSSTRRCCLVHDEDHHLLEEAIREECRERGWLTSTRDLATDLTRARIRRGERLLGEAQARTPARALTLAMLAALQGAA